MTLKQYLKNKQLSETDLELIEKLKQFSTEDDYIIGVLLDVKSENDKKLLLSYIENGKDVSYENIILYALNLSMKNK
ncbi:MAG: hypothetical protein ACI4Q5_08500 [Porcipelethomonas sp.]